MADRKGLRCNEEGDSGVFRKDIATQLLCPGWTARLIALRPLLLQMIPTVRKELKSLRAPIDGMQRILKHFCLVLPLFWNGEIHAQLAGADLIDSRTLRFKERLG
jgi:hypothetical protein